MPCNKEDGVTEVERAVQVFVVQDNRGGEDNPNGDDSGSRDLWLGSGNLGGDWGGQIAVRVLLCGQELIGWLDKWFLFKFPVSGLLGGHGWICIRNENKGRERRRRGRRVAGKRRGSDRLS